MREENVLESPEAAFVLVIDDILCTCPMKFGGVHDLLYRRLIQEKLAGELDLQMIE